MKKKFNIVLLFSSLSMLSIVSCRSHQEETNDEVADRFKSESTTTKDTVITSEDKQEKTGTKEKLVSPKEGAQASTKGQFAGKAETVIVYKNECKDDWSGFKADMENKIAANENAIKAIKNAPDVTPKMQRKLKRMEKNNNNLKSKLAEYEESAKAEKEKFKEKLKQDVSEVSADLKNIKTSSGDD